VHVERSPIVQPGDGGARADHHKERDQEYVVSPRSIMESRVR
jgi:hypothetical protein